MIVIRSDLAAALDQGLPAAALESAVISHGLPSSVSEKCALEMESQIRDAGATPATIAVIDGQIKVGILEEEIHRLAFSESATKVAARDLPLITANGDIGGTTVSATLFIADSVGIEVMATGGIGGVHRNWRETFDISADLHQITRSSCIIVCSGPKAIVDLRTTVEWLESHNVMMVGFKTNEMPAFYSARSGISIPAAEGPEHVAHIWLAKRELGQCGSLLVAAPPPIEAKTDIHGALEQAEKEAFDAGVRGPRLTPLLLRRVAELTDGDSIRVNVELLKNNARIAGEIAREICVAKTGL